MSVEMTPDGNNKYSFQETLTDIGNGESVEISPSGSPISVHFKVTSGTGKVEWTNSPTAQVQAGTAEWTVSDEGTVSATFNTTFNGSITGLRGVLLTAGSVQITISQSK